MPLSLNEIRSRALAFSNEWRDEGSEKAEGQSFWNEFFLVFGVKRRRVASFEIPVNIAMSLFMSQRKCGIFVHRFHRFLMKIFLPQSSQRKIRLRNFFFSDVKQDWQGN